MQQVTFVLDSSPGSRKFPQELGEPGSVFRPGRHQTTRNGHDIDLLRGRLSFYNKINSPRSGPVNLEVTS